MQMSGPSSGFLIGIFVWQRHQQQLPPDFTGVLVLILTLGCWAAPDGPAVPGPTRCFISAAIVKKACSTFVASLALVSSTCMPILSASSCQPNGVTQTRAITVNKRNDCYQN
jgi:hypothetical protein